MPRKFVMHGIVHWQTKLTANWSLIYFYKVRQIVLQDIVRVRLLRKWEVDVLLLCYRKGLINS